MAGNRLIIEIGNEKKGKTQSKPDSKWKRRSKMRQEKAEAFRLAGES